MNISEELDILKVQCCQDSATIHELKMCLQQERDGRFIFVLCLVGFACLVYLYLHTGKMNININLL